VNRSLVRQMGGGRDPRCRLLPVLLLGAFVLGRPMWSYAGSAPVVDSFTASSVVVAPGDIVTLIVQAHDPDCPSTCSSGCGQTIRPDLTSWTATGGSFVAEDNGIQGSPYTATADWQAPIVEDSYTVTVSLSDSGGMMCGGRSTVSADLTLQVTAVPNQAPVIDTLNADPTQLFPDQDSNLTCVAHDPDGDPMTYSWSADAGAVTAGAPGTATFLSGSPGIASVTCTVTDAGGALQSLGINISVSDAFPESVITAGLLAPQRVAIDSMGELYVVDRAGGGVSVIHLSSGELVYRLPWIGATSVAVDWRDFLLIGEDTGARVIDRRGGVDLVLNPGEPMGRVSDVAVDKANRRYVVLHSGPGRVMVYDEAGALVAAVGSASLLAGPRGVAVNPDGEIVVADSGHGTVKVFALDGALVKEFGAVGGGAGQFVHLDDVAVTAGGVIYTTDTYQDWVQAFEPDGQLREVLGTYGDGAGQFKTPAGVVSADAFNRLVVASLNASCLQVFRTEDGPPALPQPEASISPQNVAFGSQAVGTSSPPVSVSLTNSGNAPLGLQSVEVEGDFSQSNDCGSFIDRGTVCALELRFSPQAAGARTGTMSIETSIPSRLEVALSGDGFIPAGLALSPARLDFSDQAVGSVSDPKAVSVTNGGTVPLTIAAVSATQAFSFSSNCPVTLAGGASCTIDVYFNPVSTGDAIAGSLTVVTDGGTGTVSLEGRAVAWEMTVAPETVDFGLQAVGIVTPPSTVTVSNTGSEFILIEFVSLEGETPSAFALAENACSGMELLPGSSCSMAAAFGPREAGTFTATIRIAGHATQSDSFVTLRGVAGGAQRIFRDDFESGDLHAWSIITLPTLEVFLSDPGPFAWNLGEQPVGTQSGIETIWLVNDLSHEVEIGTVTLSDYQGTFGIEDDRCSGLRLSAGQSCGIEIVFSPQGLGLHEAEISVPTSEGGVSSVVRLVGIGGPAAVGRKR
jgi:sugar lactone lactonase YvrE